MTLTEQNKLNKLLEEVRILGSTIPDVTININLIIGSKSKSVDDKMRVKIKKIIEVVANVYGYKVEDILKRNRKGDYPYARHMIVHIIRAIYPNLTLQKIGKELGDRNYTTILSSLRAFQNEYDTNPNYRAKYDEAMAQINNFSNNKINK